MLDYLLRRKPANPTISDSKMGISPSPIELRLHNVTARNKAVCMNHISNMQRQFTIYAVAVIGTLTALSLSDRNNISLLLNLECCTFIGEGILFPD